MTFRAVDDIPSCPMVKPLVDRKQHGRVFENLKAADPEGFLMYSLPLILPIHCIALSVALEKSDSVWEVCL